ncbi:MAG TPA: hypothetical protein VIL35_06700, partial [Vicinamibacterales bacterium]
FGVRVDEPGAQAGEQGLGAEQAGDHVALGLDDRQDLGRAVAVVQAAAPGGELLDRGHGRGVHPPLSPDGPGEAFLQKPFALDVLIARIRYMLAEHARERGN